MRTFNPLSLLIYFCAFSFLMLMPVLSSAQTAEEYYKQAVDAGSNAEKIALFTKSIEAGKKNNWVYYGRGWAWYSMGKYERAIDDFEKADKAEGTLGKTYIYGIMGWTWYALNDYPEAEKYINKALEASPQNQSAYNCSGWLKIAKDDYAGAAEAFSKYLSIKPDGRGYQNRAYANYLAEAYPKALADYEKALEYAPNDQSLIQAKAMTLIKMGQKDKGMQLVEEKLELKENDPLSLSKIGNMFYFNGDYETAITYHTRGIKLYQKKIAEDPDFIDIYKNDIYNIYMSRGDAYEALEKYQSANQSYTVATKIDPKDPRAWLEIGELQTQLKNWQVAIRAYEKAYAIDPTLKTGWVNLGYSYSNLKQERKAILAYTRGIKNNPTVGLLYNNRGFGHLELKEYDKAKSDLEMAIKIQPEIVMSHVSLGEYFLEVGDHAAAIAKFDEALAMENGSRSAYGAAYYKRGLAYFQLEKYALAEADLTNATRLDSKSVRNWELLGKAFYEQEKLCSAYKAFQKALDLDVHNREKEGMESMLYMAKLTRNPCKDPNSK